jgi:acetyl esterase/lipase
LAGATGSTVVVVEYRLAPEHPFPAALHDVAAVYGQLLDDGRGPIVAVGDSAGGGLAAALVVAAAISDVPPPAGLVLMSAWLDLTCTAATFISRAGSDQMFSLESAEEAARFYLQGHDPRDPLASPAFARIDSWPASVVLASTAEVLLQDSLSFVSTATLAGTSMTAVLEAGRPHAWPAVFPDLPESVSALAEIARFYRRLEIQGPMVDLDA